MLGARGQLEQVFLNLLVHAEQSLAEAAEKVISIRTIVLSKRLVVEIAFTAPPEPPYRAGETASLLGVTRSVIAGHGGEARLVVKSGQDPCFEVEFPIAQERVTVAAGPAREHSRRITAMVIEPEEAAQRQLSLRGLFGFNHHGRNPPRRVAGGTGGHSHALLRDWKFHFETGILAALHDQTRLSAMPGDDAASHA